MLVEKVAYRTITQQSRYSPSLCHCCTWYIMIVFSIMFLQNLSFNIDGVYRDRRESHKNAQFRKFAEFLFSRDIPNTIWPGADLSKFILSIQQPINWGFTLNFKAIVHFFNYNQAEKWFNLHVACGLQFYKWVAITPGMSEKI